MSSWSAWHFEGIDSERGVAKASGIETPTREELSCLDRKRKKKGSNDDWMNPHDPDAKITEMKMGGRIWPIRKSMRSIWTPAP